MNLYCVSHDQCRSILTLLDLDVLVLLLFWQSHQVFLVYLFSPVCDLVLIPLKSPLWASTLSPPPAFSGSRIIFRLFSPVCVPAPMPLILPFWASNVMARPTWPTETA